MAPAISAARDGVPVDARGAYLFKILSPILVHEPEAAAIYAPEGRLLGEGDTFCFPELADALELLAAEGSEPFYRGEIAKKVSDWVLERGGTLAPGDLAAYEPVVREPVRAHFRDSEVVTNPPPSSGGTLIAFALELLDRMGSAGVEELVAVMAEAQDARGDEFVRGLSEEGFASRFLDPEMLAEASRSVSSRLGSTTHITAMDSGGCCASVTCSNGTGSGLVVPGTGVHVNNMLGEEDLNPLGFHLWEAGSRLPSMMSPTIILRDGELVAGLGSAGSNRIRSAIVQVILRLIDDGMSVDEAVEAPRVHFEGAVVSAEPGIDAEALARIEAGGAEVDRWAERNMFFGGVQAVTRDPGTGELQAAGDPRRGGAVALRRPRTRSRATSSIAGSTDAEPELGEGDLSVHLRRLGDLARALEHPDQVVKGLAQELHPLGLGAELQQALLGQDRQLDAGGDRIGVAFLQAFDLGL